MSWLLLNLALAGAPAEIRPFAASADFPQAYAAWAKESGKGPAIPACKVVWPDHALLCFRVWEGNTRRWVTTDDLLDWQVGVDALLEQTAEAARARLSGLTVEPIAGMEDRYWTLRDGDGWAAVALLDPNWVRAQVGAEEIRVALPSEGILYAWPVKSDELDRVMAVATTETFTGAAKGPVSSMVFTWDGQAWTRFGAAKAKADTSGK